jgi:C-terminal processing protease CtpA/Prc
MKTYLLFAILYFNSLLAFCQKTRLEKASPFTAVRWEREKPIVQFDNEWYNLEKLDRFSTNELIDFCKKQYGSKWQKRFSEDLVEVLSGLNDQALSTVELLLSQNGISRSYKGIFTIENRIRAVQYNRISADSNLLNSLHQKISVTEALADLRQFEEIVADVSSYSQFSTFNYKLAIEQEAAKISTASNEIEINTLTNDIRKIMAEIGDRHASVKNESFQHSKHSTFNLQLPFQIAMLHGKTIALKKSIRTDESKLYFDSHPYLKSINGVAIETLMYAYNYKDKMAPEQIKRSRGVKAVQKYGQLLFENNMDCPDSIAVVFTNGKATKTQTFKLSAAPVADSSKPLIASKNTQIKKGNFEDLSRILTQNIGYINIPEMYNYEDAKGLDEFIKTTIESFSNTKALIIDIRDNPGGSREILQTFAPYIIQAKQSPWVANVAYQRTNNQSTGDDESMSSRYLYQYDDDNFSESDRKAIKQFETNLNLQKSVDPTKFSKPFYMVLHSSTTAYLQPIYILVNEETFSAASVFASYYKDLPNVKIVGEITDGSSGNSKTLYLKNSHIRINVSTMLSFQRNGKTLDGNGTVPDILIQTDEKQVMKGSDSQLNKLIEIINETHCN